MKELYNPKAFIAHAAWLDQGCPHCPRFPTAASRRSLGRVSVPVWLIILSNQLPIVGLVSRYPTNYLIGRGPIPRRKLSPVQTADDRSPPEASRFWHPIAVIWRLDRAYPALIPVSRGYSEPKGTFPRVTHPSAADPRKGPLDLHVLSLPPAFVLSQDQTLKLKQPEGCS